MDSQDALSLANERVECDRVAVEGLASIRLRRAAGFYPPAESHNDEWVVLYRRSMPDDVVESPALVIVIVDDATGEVSYFETL